MTQKEFTLFIKVSEPHTTDPDPRSSLVFRDKDGLFYEVHGASLLNPDLDSSIWKRRLAIKQAASDRGPESIFVDSSVPNDVSPTPQVQIPDPEQPQISPEQERISAALKTLLQHKRHLSEKQVEQLSGLVHLARNYISNKPK
ncbi:MAG: hypothetical protein OEY44_00325 [Candidatus Peregrinibacteria bacterium]|nr:hypothetical protein [Candidatus Peregrinibacteria bacterium]